MTNFNTNCTLPEAVVNYVSQPNTRGTLDILWSCLGTIILCTWSVQHPNVPELRTAHGNRSRYRDVIKQAWMMVFTLLAPEFLLLKAVSDLHSAGSISKKLGVLAKGDGVPWSMVHSFFSNMGGFVIHFKDVTPTPTPVAVPEIQSSPLPSAQLTILEDRIRDVEISDTATASAATTVSIDCEKAIHSATAQSSRVSSTVPSALDDQVRNFKASHIATTPTAVAIDCEKARTSTTTQTTPRKPTMPTDSDPLRSQNERLCKILNSREKYLPKSTHRNSIIMQEILADLKSRAVSGRDMGHTFLELIDVILNLLRLGGEYWALDGPQLIRAREMGVIAKVPNVSESEIEDKSIGDFFVKFLAVIHTGWQIAQLIARYAERLPASQTEVATVAFALCAFWTYIFLWSKPQDVKTPYIIEATRYPTREEMFSLSEKGPTYIGGMFTGYEYTIPEHTFHRSVVDKVEVLEGGYFGWAGGIFGGMLFGMVHLAAWNFNFPTPAERILWRVAAVAASAAPLVWGARGIWLAAFHRIRFQKERKDFVRVVILTVDRVVFPIVGMGIGSLYVLSRLYLLVETFRSLFFLLPDTFQAI
jgi:hypothetical protein